jgi:hypothetical protein
MRYPDILIVVLLSCSRQFLVQNFYLFMTATLQAHFHLSFINLANICPGLILSGTVVVKALSYNPEGREFETR